MKWTQEQMDNAYQTVMQKAMVDAEFRSELLENPNAAISKVTGLEVDDDYKIRIIERDPAYQATFFLPDIISEEISADDLDTVVGGSCGANACAANGCAGQATK